MIARRLVFNTNYGMVKLEALTMLYHGLRCAKPAAACQRANDHNKKALPEFPAGLLYFSL